MRPRRFPRSEEVRAQLLSIFALHNRYPHAEDVDISQQIYERLDAPQRNQLLRSSIGVLIGRNRQSVRTKISLHQQDQGQPDALDDPHQEFTAYCERNAHQSDEVPLLPKEPNFPLEVLTPSALRLFIESIIIHSPVFPLLLEPLRQAGWTDERVCEVLIRFIQRDLTCAGCTSSVVFARQNAAEEEGGQPVIPMGISGFLLQTICHDYLQILTAFRGWKAHGFAITLAQAQQLFSGEEDVVQCKTVPQSGRDRLAALELLDRPREPLTRETIAYQRQRTDTLRGEVFPDLLQQRVPMRDAFWHIHGALFTNPSLAHVHSSDSGADVQYAVRSGGEKFYQSSVGKVRTFSVRGGGIEHLSPGYLPHLEESFFRQLEEAMTGTTSEAEFLDLVTKVEMILNIAHLPFDGSGRSSGEFITFLSQSLQYPLTMARNGYLDLASPLIERRLQYDVLFKREFDHQCLHEIGIDTPLFAHEEDGTPYDVWLEHILLKIQGTNRHDCFMAERVSAIDRLIHALPMRDDFHMLQELYPIAEQIRSLYAEARREAYVQPSPGLASTCDDLVAEMVTKYGPEAKERIAREAAAHPEDLLLAQLREMTHTPSSPAGWIMASKLGDDGEKRRCLRQALALDPRDSHAWTLLGLAATNDEEALDCMGRAHRLSPYSPTPCRIFSDIAREGGDLERAERLLHQSLHSDSYNVLSLCQLAALYEDFGRVCTAEGYLHEAIRGNRRNERGYLDLAAFLYRWGAQDEARELYGEMQKWIPQDDPQPFDAWVASLGPAASPPPPLEELQFMDLPDETDGDPNTRQELDLTKPIPREDLARFSNIDIFLAECTLAQMHEKEPDNPVFLSNVGVLSEELKERSATSKQKKKEVQDSPKDDKFFVDHALSLIDKHGVHDNFSAEGYLRAAIRLNPLCLQAHWELARYLRVNGWLIDAGQEFALARACPQSEDERARLQIECDGFERSLQE